MRSLAVAAVSFVVMAATPAVACVGLEAPVEGPVVAEFAPRGRYAGHWGVDIAAPSGTPVRAAGSGVVSFAGAVAGMRAVTVDHGGGLLSTVSWIADHAVGRGTLVGRATVLGWSDEHDGRLAVHLSTRIDGRYVDPIRLLGCAARAPADAVRLVPVP